MADQNGKPKHEAEIKCVFDPETYCVRIRFLEEEFKNWDFVVAVLGMALDTAKQMRMNMMMNQAHGRIVPAVQVPQGIEIGR